MTIRGKIHQLLNSTILVFSFFIQPILHLISLSRWHRGFTYIVGFLSQGNLQINTRLCGGSLAEVAVLRLSDTLSVVIIIVYYMTRSFQSQRVNLFGLRPFSPIKIVKIRCYSRYSEIQKKIKVVCFF